MVSTPSMNSTPRTAGRVISAVPTGSIPATRVTPRSRPPSFRRSAPEPLPLSVRYRPHRRSLMSFGRIRSKRLRLHLEDVADLQRQVQREPDFGIAQVNAEQVLDPAQSVEHGIAMEVQAVGRIGRTAIGREVGSERMQQHAAAVL